MLQQKEASSFLYVGDWSTNDVYIYAYPSGTSIGTITGNSEPYGMCVDAKGNLYVADFGAGIVNEYEVGGTKVLNTYDPGGELIGCSVDSKGDVAATSFNPGEVTVYARGNPKKGKTFSNSACEYQWTMGYDDKGNLVGVGEDTSIEVCAVLAGSKFETTLSTKGIAISFPGGTMWDGRHIALGDQDAGGNNETGVWPSTLSGTTLSSSKEVIFSNTCDGNYEVDANPFILGEKNTPVNRQQGSVMVGPDAFCSSDVYLWHYPKGGDPFKTYSLNVDEPYGVGVSVHR